MAEEADVVDLKVDLQKEEEKTEEVIENTPAELAAMDDGWRPESEWEGESEDWVGAREFNFRGELMSKITNQSGKLSESSKKIDELSRALKVLGEHQKKTSEVEHKRILSALKREKASALEEGDNTTVVDIDEKMSELKESKKTEDLERKKAETVEEEGTKEVPPEINAWFSASENSWYHKDNILKAIADSVSIEYLNKHGDSDLTAMLKHVDKTVRKEMPHKFKTAERSQKVIETSGNTRSRGKKFTKRDLNEEQASVAKTFVDMGVYPNVQAFVDELVKNGDLN